MCAVTTTDGRAARTWAGLKAVFARLGKDNVTGLAAMVAYNLAISVIPLAVLALWVAGRVAGSTEFEEAISRDLGAIFPGPADNTLRSLLGRIRTGAPGLGVAAIVFSIWTGMSFWGAIDTAFDRIYELPSRGWIKQKRFSFLMLWLVVLFMAATIAVPIAQSAIAGVRRDLPFGLDTVPGAALVFSLAIGVALLFLTLLAIYSLGPNRRLPWREVWPGALFATVIIAGTDYIYPYYLTNVSSVWRFGTTAVFLVIVLAWFYLVALVILLGAELNAWRLTRRRARRAALGESPESGDPTQDVRSDGISRKQST